MYIPLLFPGVVCLPFSKHFHIFIGFMELVIVCYLRLCRVTRRVSILNMLTFKLYHIHYTIIVHLSEKHHQSQSTHSIYCRKHYVTPHSHLLLFYKWIRCNDEEQRNHEITSASARRKPESFISNGNDHKSFSLMMQLGNFFSVCQGRYRMLLILLTRLLRDFFLYVLFTSRQLCDILTIVRNLHAPYVRILDHFFSR
jgi:hypothetical protein